MKPRLFTAPSASVRGLLITVLALALVSRAHAGLYEILFPHPIDVVTVTDVTAEGKKLTPPTPNQPAYYEAINIGYMDLGASTAGDQPPAKKVMLDTIMQTLAANGYRPATKGHKPTLLLAFTWGTLRGNRAKALRFLGGDKLGLMEDAAQRYSFVNSDVLLRGFRSGEAVTIIEDSNNPLYVAVVSAYDFKAVNDGRATLLWQTRMGCPTPGLLCTVVLPELIKAGGPSFGRESLKPAWVHRSDKLKPSVEMGETRLLEYLDSPDSKIIDVELKPATGAPPSSKAKP